MPRSRSNPAEPPRRYFKELRFRQFRAFREVARTLNFAEAAEVLGLSKTSLWQQVRSLEEELETQLLRTESQHVSLTEDGVVLLDLISPLVESFESVRSVFLDRRRNVVRRLTVATPSSLLAHELLEPVHEYRKVNPEVRLSFMERPSREVIPLLESGQVDLALMGALSEEPLPASMEFQKCTEYPFVLICSSSHPLARGEEVSLASLASLPLLLPAQATCARRWLDGAFAKAGLLEGLNVVLESVSALVLARFAQLELGVALTSISPILVEQLRGQESGPDRLVIRDARELFGAESILLVQKKGKPQLPHIAEFCRHILGSGRKAVSD